MASGTMKQNKRRARRRIAAVNFLSNISLDGSYRDTKYAMFNRKHHRLKHDNAEEGEQSALKRPVTSSATSENKNQVDSQESVTDGTTKLSANIAEIRVENVRKKSTHKVDKGDQGHCTPSKLTSATTVAADEKEISHGKNFHGDKGERLSRGNSNISTSSSVGGYPQKEIKIHHSNSRRKLKNERLLIVSERKVPMVVCSTLEYSKESQMGRLEEEIISNRTRQLSGTKSFSSQEGLLYMGLHAIGKVEDGQDISYSEFLTPSISRGMKRVASERGPLNTQDSIINHPLLRSHSHDPAALLHRMSITPSLEKVPESHTVTYHANILDDSELQSGSYRTLLSFPSYMTSVIEYVKPSTLKKEVNEKFKERFPNIQLTLTKLRSIKRELRRIAHIKCGLDLWVIAQAYVFYEKLILKCMINKQNRKLCAGACLLLSAKLSDVKGEQLTKLIQQVEDEFRLNRKELLMFEFACLVGLEFTLHVPDCEVFPHYQRLLYQS